jgi:hypothetical protein
VVDIGRAPIRPASIQDTIIIIIIIIIITVIGTLYNQHASALVRCYVSWEICTKSTEENLALNQEDANHWSMA